MATQEGYTINDMLEFPNAVVVAALRAMEFYGSEPDICASNKFPKYRKKAKLYRAMMAKIVDMMSICDERASYFKTAPDDPNDYISNYEMAEVFERKKSALKKLASFLKTRFSENYNKAQFLEKLEELRGRIFPKNFARPEINAADAAIFCGLEDLAKERKIIDNYARTDIFTQAEWLAEGGEICYGTEIGEGKQQEIKGLPYSFNDLSNICGLLDEPQIIQTFYRAVVCYMNNFHQAQLNGKDTANEELNLYQRRENGMFAQLPELTPELEKDARSIVDSAFDLFQNSNFAETFEYKDIIKFAKYYIQANDIITQKRNKRNTGTQDILPLDWDSRR